MTVGADKHRRYITFPKVLENKLEILAKKDKRSFPNLILKILEEYVEQADKAIEK